MEEKEKEKEDEKSSYKVMWTQQKINEMFMDSIKTRDDFIYALLKEKEDIRELYAKVIIKIVGFVVIPLVIMMSIFFISYFFSDYTEYNNYEGNTTTETMTTTESYSDSNVIQNNEMQDSNISLTE